MTKIEINGHKINVPTSWSDITLSNCEKWYMLRPQTKQEHIEHLAKVCKVDVELLQESPSEVFNTLMQRVGFTFEADKVAPLCKVLVDGEDYFIATSDKLTLGEWVDVDATLHSGDDNKLSQMLAIVCRPAGEKYNADLMEERTKLFGAMTCDKVLPLISFFLQKEKKSREILHLYSAVLGQAAQFLKDTKTFAQSGDGIKRLPIWQRIKYTFLMKSLEKQLSKFSDLCSIV